VDKKEDISMVKKEEKCPETKMKKLKIVCEYRHFKNGKWEKCKHYKGSCMYPRKKILKK